MSMSTRTVRLRDYFSADDLDALPADLGTVVRAAAWDIDVDLHPGGGGLDGTAFAVRLRGNDAARKLERIMAELCGTPRVVEDDGPPADDFDGDHRNGGTASRRGRRT